jgi:hypothetical protein
VLQPDGLGLFRSETHPICLHSLHQETGEIGTVFETLVPFALLENECDARVI